MWRLVTEVTQGRNRTAELPPPSLSADSINKHYAGVSTDPNYIPPLHKLSCSPPPPSFVPPFLGGALCHQFI